MGAIYKEDFADKHKILTVPNRSAVSGVHDGYGVGIVKGSANITLVSQGYTTCRGFLAIAAVSATDSLIALSHGSDDGKLKTSLTDFFHEVHGASGNIAGANVRLAFFGNKDRHADGTMPYTSNVSGLMTKIPAGVHVHPGWLTPPGFRSLSATVTGNNITLMIQPGNNQVQLPWSQI